MQAKFGIEPEYETGDVWQRLKGKQPPRAFLAIGDEALLLREHPDYPHRLDLGGAWLEWTGLPFIFGVWLANKNSCAHKPNTVNAGIKTLLASKTWGQQHLEYIAQLAARKKAFNLDQMQEYFQGLVFDLGPREMEGLQRFFQELHQTGLIEKLPSPETFKGSFCS